MADNNWPSVLHKVQRAQKNLARQYLVLIREEANARTLGRIFVAVVQAVILYGSEM